MALGIYFLMLLHDVIFECIIIFPTRLFHNWEAFNKLIKILIRSQVAIFGWIFPNKLFENIYFFIDNFSLVIESQRLADFLLNLLILFFLSVFEQVLLQFYQFLFFVGEYLFHIFQI